MGAAGVAGVGLVPGAVHVVAGVVVQLEVGWPHGGGGRARGAASTVVTQKPTRTCYCCTTTTTTAAAP